MRSRSPPYRNNYDPKDEQFKKWMETLKDLTGQVEDLQMKKLHDRSFNDWAGAPENPAFASPQKRVRIMNWSAEHA